MTILPGALRAAGAGAHGGDYPWLGDGGGGGGGDGARLSGGGGGGRGGGGSG